VSEEDKYNETGKGSTRDRIALKAMHAAIVCDGCLESGPLAKFAYEVADAMIAERERKKT